MSDKKVVTRRAFLAMASTTAAATGLAACGSTPTAQPAAPTEAPSEPAEAEEPAPAEAPSTSEQARPVEFWGTGSASSEVKFRELLVELRDNTGFHIEFVKAPGGWTSQFERINASLAAGTAPDLAHIKDYKVWDYAWRDTVLPLDDYIAASGFDLGQLRDSIQNAMHYNEQIIGTPWRGSFVWVQFVNDDLFEQAGLDPSADVPTTWEEMVEVSTQLTDEGTGQFGYSYFSLGTLEPDFFLFTALQGQAGGSSFNEDVTKLTLDTPEGNEAMQFMYDMLHTWKIAIPPDQMESAGELIKTGLVGSWHTGPWFVADARANAPQLNFSLHPVPCHKTCDNVDTPELMVIFKDVEDRDLSWQAMQHLLDPKFDLEIAPTVGYVPAYKENVDKLPEIVEQDKELWATFMEIGSAENLRPRQWTEGYEDMIPVVTPELQAVWFDQAGVQEGLAAAEMAGNEALARAKSG